MGSFEPGGRQRGGGPRVVGLFGGNAHRRRRGGVLGRGRRHVGRCRPSARASPTAGFRACRRDNRIEVEHGLLQHQFPGRRRRPRAVGSGEARASSAACMGYCELSLGQDRRGGGKLQRGPATTVLNTRGLVIHPFVKLDRVPEILAGHHPRICRRARGQQAGRARGAAPRAHPPLPHPGHRDSGWPSPWPSCRSCSTWSSMPTCRKTWPCSYFAEHVPPPSATRSCFVLLVLRRHRRRAVVPRFRDSPTTSGFMQVSNGGFAREDHQFPAQKDSVRLHEDEPLPAPRPYRHRQRAHGSGHRRHDGPPDRRM